MANGRFGPSMKVSQSLGAADAATDLMAAESPECLMLQTA